MLTLWYVPIMPRFTSAKELSTVFVFTSPRAYSSGLVFYSAVSTREILAYSHISVAFIADNSSTRVYNITNRSLERLSCNVRHNVTANLSATFYGCEDGSFLCASSPLPQSRGNVVFRQHKFRRIRQFRLVAGQLASLEPSQSECGSSGTKRTCN